MKDFLFENKEILLKKIVVFSTTFLKILIFMFLNCSCTFFVIVGNNLCYKKKVVFYYFLLNVFILTILSFKVKRNLQNGIWQAIYVKALDFVNEFLLLFHKHYLHFIFEPLKTLAFAS